MFEVYLPTAIVINAIGEYLKPTFEYKRLFLYEDWLITSNFEPFLIFVYAPFVKNLFYGNVS